MNVMNWDEALPANEYSPDFSVAGRVKIYGLRERR